VQVSIRQQISREEHTLSLAVEPFTTVALQHVKLCGIATTGRTGMTGTRKLHLDPIPARLVANHRAGLLPSLLPSLLPMAFCR